MSGRMGATEGALLRGADRVGAAHESVLYSLGRIDGQLDEISGAWTGNAATSYAELLREWGDRGRNLNAVLVQLQEALRATHGDQVAVEELHQRSIGRIGAMMGDSA